MNGQPSVRDEMTSTCSTLTEIINDLEAVDANSFFTIGQIYLVQPEKINFLPQKMNFQFKILLFLTK